eukprot:9975465-Ditylum_brightwellii.AAC.1
MNSLPEEWDTMNIEQLTTQTREYLATVISNRAHNKLQRKIAKKKTSSISETKTGDKGNTSGKGGKNSHQELEPYQKEILKGIHQGKHTPERR